MAITLGVNIDHIATLRQARGGEEPDPLEGAKICEQAGAHGVTVHLREDRRHIQDKDIYALKDIITGKYNLELALSDDVISIAKKVKPNQVTFVPEKREELTTEGGLDVKHHYEKLKYVIADFKNLNITVSLFIEPDISTVELSKSCGADAIEIHTGTYCNAKKDQEIDKELNRIIETSKYAKDHNLIVNAGHGLNTKNILPLLQIPNLEEVNIGHSIISRSIFIGLDNAVKEMLEILQST